MFHVMPLKKYSARIFVYFLVVGYVFASEIEMSDLPRRPSVAIEIVSNEDDPFIAELTAGMGELQIANIKRTVEDICPENRAVFIDFINNLTSGAGVAYRYSVIKKVAEIAPVHYSEFTATFNDFAVGMGESYKKECVKILGSIFSVFNFGSYPAGFCANYFRGVNQLTDGMNQENKLMVAYSFAEVPIDAHEQFIAMINKLTIGMRETCRREVIQNLACVLPQNYKMLVNIGETLIKDVNDDGKVLRLSKLSDITPASYCLLALTHGCSPRLQLSLLHIFLGITPGYRSLNAARALLFTRWIDDPSERLTRIIQVLVAGVRKKIPIFAGESIGLVNPYLIGVEGSESMEEKSSGFKRNLSEIHRLIGPFLKDNLASFVSVSILFSQAFKIITDLETKHAYLDPRDVIFYMIFGLGVSGASSQLISGDCLAAKVPGMFYINDYVTQYQDLEISKARDAYLARAKQ